jgi:hypothetical protein
MKIEEITVKSKDFGEFKYNLEQPETLAESVGKYGEKESLEWLLAGRKAEINAAEWQKVRGTKTEEVEAGGKKFRIPKELAAVVREALAKQMAAA